ncbi:family 20 glycosylhydrolase [Desertivirga xinjiangensis]|uniref:family 20 glycosylhydrolase n=1 Tax=Desertivirga xinjiangensis TaxID=539206 RepID=UPI0021087E4B|nr:family 20 glycosylhydrolase [Pedobacter xinjiangensis]
MLYSFTSNRHKLMVLLAMLFSLSSLAQDVHEKMEVRWQVVKGDPGKPDTVSSLTLYNRSDETISCENWSLWFNFMRAIAIGSVDERFKIRHSNGDLYQLSFIDKKLVIPAKDSITISFTTNGILPNFTDAPSGLYVTYDGAEEKKAYKVKYSSESGKNSMGYALSRLAEQYDANQLAETAARQQVTPSPLALQQGEGSYIITSRTLLWADPVFRKEETYLRKFLNQTAGVQLPEKASRKDGSHIKILNNPALGEEEYELLVNRNGISIKAGTAKGAFYAVQTIMSLSTAGNWKLNSKKLEIPSVTIRDKPRFGYRGLMLDVARNFQTKESVKRIIDVMALYKLNTLHWHLNDDEGWRLEIPSLPELTEVGSVRSGSYPDGKSLQPSYGSGADATEKAYYSVSDFKEVLKYAAERHIQVITELETPGHARAAIKSMEARYNKYMLLGNKQEAEKYLLHDIKDKSEYVSAQRWNDNVMNVALPSVYRFISTVLDDIKSICEEAGIPLKKVHLGGDEVPRGVWEKSPEIARLCDSLKLESVHEVWPYYIRKIADLCKAKDLELAGWEEMGMVNNGKGMTTNPQLVDAGIQLDVWNNLAGGGQEDLAYKLANAGYKVVFTSANNFYFDLAWKDTFDEPGHTWAGFTNLRKSYSFLPENYFLNISYTNAENKLAEGYFNKKEALTEEGKRNLIGIKGAVWTEKIQDQERLEYMLLPRLIALAERAWAVKPAWESGATFNHEDATMDYARFMKQLSSADLPKLDILNGGYSYRLPALGLKIQEGLVLCNTEYPGFDIYYTTDGTQPGLSSNKYSRPFLPDTTKTYKFNIVTGGGRSGDTVSLKFNQ